ncbi:MAG: hypothetical protein G8237_00555 [Magnetococcales bacterium]|nr:hypothetical protein [Magnetococcales bacterium]NGZ04830.1 hypothetical protein [Magnetococcales bacterium]
MGIALDSLDQNKLISLEYHVMICRDSSGQIIEIITDPDKPQTGVFPIAGRDDRRATLLPALSTAQEAVLHDWHARMQNMPDDVDGVIFVGPQSLLYDPETNQLSGYIINTYWDTYPLADCIVHPESATIPLSLEERYAAAWKMTRAVQYLHAQGYATTHISLNMLSIDANKNNIYWLEFHDLQQNSSVPPSDPDNPESNDLYNLATTLFQLLMHGFHPFQGQWNFRKGPEPPRSTLQLCGLLPYHPRNHQRIQPPTDAPDYSTLAIPVQKLLNIALTLGGRHPDQCPTTQTWLDTLHEAIRHPYRKTVFLKLSRRPTLPALPKGCPLDENYLPYKTYGIAALLIAILVIIFKVYYTNSDEKIMVTAQIRDALQISTEVGSRINLVSSAKDKLMISEQLVSQNSTRYVQLRDQDMVTLNEQKIKLEKELKKYRVVLQQIHTKKSDLWQQAIQSIRQEAHEPPVQARLNLLEKHLKEFGRNMEEIHWLDHTQKDFNKIMEEISSQDAHNTKKP